jgi:hypothetical protein
MELSDRLRRWTGWVCLGMLATMAFLGYLFGNIRFAPLAAGFAILAAVCLVERGPAPMRTDGIHPRRDSGVSRASG